jgi:hypothetical protein
LLSQYRLLSRNSSEIPESCLRNLQNKYRRVINLNGEWSVTSNEPPLNASVQVPFCYDFNGRISCKRSFTVDFENPSEWNYIIHCDGINYQCKIKINNNFIIKHEGGFTPFSSPIPEGFIKESSNTIEIKIDNQLDNSKTIPFKNTANYPKNYGGIYRDIYILAVPKVYVKSAGVYSEIDINLNADIKTTITISATDISKYQINDTKFIVKTELLDTGGVKASSEPKNFTISPNSTIQVENNFTASNPVYWSPEAPHLYTLRVMILYGADTLDVYQTDFGIYELLRKTGGIIINKSELKFKGVNYTEEFGGKGICPLYEDIERDVKNIKSLGCNVIKVYGRPASLYMVDLCNKYGLLIMEEIPAHTVPEDILDSETFLALAENQLSEMVYAHKNSPCIFAYGLGNDFDVTGEEGRAYIKRMAAAVKNQDSRLIYYSTRNYFKDKCRDLVDMVGINFYDGDLNILKTIASDVKVKKEKIFISNYGKVINPPNTSGYSDPNSIEAQSKYIVDFYKFYKSSPFLGSFFHSYTDWNSEMPNLRFFDKTNPYMRTSGLYTLYREQRPPVVILRKNFLDEDIPNLNIGTYTKEAPLVFVFIGLITFILFLYLSNSVRRFRENVWRSLFRPFIFFTDVREQNLIPTLHNMLLAAILSIGNGLFFANLLYYWKDSQLFDIMLSVIFSRSTIKIFFDDYVHNPLKLTALLSAVSFVRFFLITIIIWFFSLTVKYRIRINNIFTVVVWGLFPTVLLLILGTFYIRILSSNPDFVIIGLVTAGLLYLISIYRILKGTHIIFDIFFLKVYSYGIGTVILIAGGLWFYLNSSKFLFDYLGLVLIFLKG